MDDLEKAIIISFDESGNINPSLKAQAIAYSQQIKETPSIHRLFIERLSYSNYTQVQFWCLQALEEVLRLRYSSLNSDERSFIRKSITSIACLEGLDGQDSSTIRVLNAPVFVKNKLAQIIVTLIHLEYPIAWSSIFLDFLSHLSKGPLVVDMFCRVLNALDEELISLDYPRSQEELQAAVRVKDAMRQQCVPQIVGAWYELVTLYKDSNPELAASVLDTMHRYVNWIDIGLIANEVFVPLLFEIMLSELKLEHLRCASSTCVSSIVGKRMDPQSKLTLLRKIQINRVFSLVLGDEETQLKSTVSDLLTCYATEVLDCSKRLDSEKVCESNIDYKSLSIELLDEVLPSVFYVMKHNEIDSSFNTVQFLSNYVSTMKSLSPLREKHILHLGQILEVIRARICYEPIYRENLNIPDKIGMEEEDRMLEYRRDLFVLLRSAGRVAPDVTQLFVRNTFATALGSSEMQIEEVEAAISLLYAIGEAISDEGIRTGTGVLGEIVPLLLSARFPCHSHRLVALAHLETVFRYAKFVQEHTEYVHVVLGVFLDARGIHHPNRRVSRRASYLFTRVVKLLRGHLIPFIPTILQSLQDTVVEFTRSDWSAKELKGMGSEDGSHIFEAIGLLIGMEEVSPDKQSEYLSALLVPLCRQVDSLLSNSRQQNPADNAANVVRIQQAIVAINALSKGFSERLVTTGRPTIGYMFKQTLDVLMQVLVVFPKHEQLRSKVTSFLHRMVDTLGPSVFPYLPRALEQLLVESEPKELVSFLVLINQLISKFKGEMGAILEEIFPFIASRVFHILPKDVFPSGPGGNTEELRELQELQRTLYTFLHVMTTHDLSSVFLTPKSREYLDEIMRLLLYTACTHKDILVRKACVQIFVKLIRDWCTLSNEEEKVPGFRSFIIETFATNCCLYSVLDSSFELRDANTLVLFGEIVAAQKVMYEKFGNDFLIHFVNKGFPAAHCPQNLAEQYCQTLQCSDVKALKSFYQSLIENLRHQQNGSLVFR
ncbi:exportin-T isoform X2 [Amborella trichopoda]|uniref:exportin-T isoform X2 n=1 Tax=Amborella trichopoda TaxID=13333 RepID=UPI0005D3C2CE|nr:exportin-T isoform X2 [Amborella trichopoda]|eukprot:XP_011625319.1 exportin-T isoform X2 [Amborella trichopoda]